MGTKGLDDGGVAFPTNNMNLENRGMSLRDWFAGQMLAGMSANKEYNSMSGDTVADWCYSQADLLIAKKRKDEGDKT